MQPAQDARTEPAALAAAWEQARAAGLNNRAAARQLGVSEAELLASACGHFAIRLQPEFPALLARLPELAEIKCIVRNPWAVLERAGQVHATGAGAGGIVRVAADRFEAECRLGSWGKAFALEEVSAGGTKFSLQFFTAAGVSAAKFFLRQNGSVTAFRTLVEAFAAPDQSPQQTVTAAQPVAYLPLERLVAVRHDGLLAFLETARRARLQLQVLLRNGAASLTTSKAVERVKRSDRGVWVNVLDDGLDLHLHERSLRYLRLVRAPDADAGWFHWFSDRREVALSVHVRENWTDLARIAGAIAL
jgi:putative hemin transport protein